jgi:gamma-carbonic anhydrase
MIMPYLGISPKIPKSVFIAPSADVIGDVTMGENASIWFQTVVRGDINTIKIGARTNIQDLSLCHVTRKTAPLIIGDDVTVGHKVTLHGCIIGNRVLVGMGAIILDQAEIGEDCFIGAGALVTQRLKIPPRSLVLGSPAKVVRQLKDSEVKGILDSAKNYVEDANEFIKIIKLENL